MMKLQPIGVNILPSFKTLPSPIAITSAISVLNDCSVPSFNTIKPPCVFSSFFLISIFNIILSPSVSVGDKVIYNKFAGTEVNVDGEKYLILKETDILIKIK